MKKRQQDAALSAPKRQKTEEQEIKHHLKTHAYKNQQGCIYAPHAEMWSTEHGAATSVSSTLHARKLLNTHSLYKLTFETSDSG